MMITTVLLWSLGIWQAMALECDVEGLRCEVICSFPDLTIHCTRCLNRRPMRFGKRSKRSPSPIAEQLYHPSSLFPVAFDPEYKTQDFVYDSDTILSTPDHQFQGNSRMYKTRDIPGLANQFPEEVMIGNYPLPYALSTDQQEVSENKRRLYGAAFEKPSGQSLVQMSGFPRSKYYPLSAGDLSVISDTDTTGRLYNLRAQPMSPLQSYNSQPNKDVTDTFNGMSKEDTYDLLAEMPISNALTFLTSKGKMNSLTERRKRPSATTDLRPKRSVQSVLEDLMSLLGLEELPVDPRLFGCHEIILPISRDTYIVMNDEKK